MPHQKLVFFFSDLKSSRFSGDSVQGFAEGCPASDVQSTIAMVCHKILNWNYASCIKWAALLSNGKRSQNLLYFGSPHFSLLILLSVSCNDPTISHIANGTHLLCVQGQGRHHFAVPKPMGATTTPLSLQWGKGRNDPKKKQHFHDVCIVLQKIRSCFTQE